MISPPRPRIPAARLRLRLRLPPPRTFLSFPSAAPQVLTARRALPYHHARLFELIADIDSYAGFLPYCKASRVTAWTTLSENPEPEPEPGNEHRQGRRRRWPARADLTAGWGALEETYTSRVFCVPGSKGSTGNNSSSSSSSNSSNISSNVSIVEAISGDARTEIPASVLARYGLSDPGPQDGNDSSSSSRSGVVFQSLVTRWTVSPAAAAAAAEGDASWSDVRLSIKFRFANPLYGAVSSAVADKVAPVMVEAFVAQARRVLGEPGRGRGIEERRAGSG
ncbi:dehydrase and lipid transport-domain-containing protein [Biscogniauxia marginata]|nr:dehydrase and lipid transport-domain-containing protein [Biscogniauxia marginata]